PLVGEVAEGRRWAATPQGCGATPWGCGTAPRGRGSASQVCGATPRGRNTAYQLGNTASWGRGAAFQRGNTAPQPCGATPWSRGTAFQLGDAAPQPPGTAFQRGDAALQPPGTTPRGRSMAYQPGGGAEVRRRGDSPGTARGKTSTGRFSGAHGLECDAQWVVLGLVCGEVQLLKSDDAAGTILHQDDFFPSFFADILILRLSEPDGKSMAGAVVKDFYRGHTRSPSFRAPGGWAERK